MGVGMDYLMSRRLECHFVTSNLWTITRNHAFSDGLLYMHSVFHSLWWIVTFVDMNQDIVYNGKLEMIVEEDLEIKDK